MIKHVFYGYRDQTYKIKDTPHTTNQDVYALTHKSSSILSTPSTNMRVAFFKWICLGLNSIKGVGEVKIKVKALRYFKVEAV